MIFIDTSYYLSISVEDDSNYKKAVRLYEEIKKEEMYTSEDVLKETLTLISQRQGKEVSIIFYDKLLEGTSIIPSTSEIFTKALQIFLNPNLNKNISLIDCTSVVVCKERDIKIITFDSHFKSLGLKVLP